MEGLEVPKSLQWKVRIKCLKVKPHRKAHLEVIHDLLLKNGGVSVSFFSCAHYGPLFYVRSDLCYRRATKWTFWSHCFVMHHAFIWCAFRPQWSAIWLNVVRREVRSLCDKRHVVPRGFHISFTDIINFHLASLFLFSSFLKSHFLSLWSHRPELHVKLFRLSGCDTVQRRDQQAEEGVWRHPENDTRTGAGPLFRLQSEAQSSLLSIL